jgi:hypothetical protein
VILHPQLDLDLESLSILVGHEQLSGNIMTPFQIEECASSANGLVKGEGTLLHLF